MAPADAGNGSHLEHPALLYRGPDQFLEVMVPYVRDGVDGGEAVLVAARGDYLPALRAELGGAASGAHLTDTNEWFPHPAKRLRAFHEFVTEELAQGATKCRLAEEPLWPVDQPELTREWQRYESVLNEVLAPYATTLLCLYDAAALDQSVIASVCQTHPSVRRNGETEPCPNFTAPEEFLSSLVHELSTVPSSAARMPDVVDVGAARRFLDVQALEAGVEPDRVLDLAMAANEILTNAFIHAEGASLWTWFEPERFVIQIENRGDAIPDPLAGYRPPSRDLESGRGLWLARQLVDLLQIVPGEAKTTFRLHVAL